MQGVARSSISALAGGKAQTAGAECGNLASGLLARRRHDPIDHHQQFLTESVRHQQVSEELRSRVLCDRVTIDYQQRVFLKERLRKMFSGLDQFGSRPPFQSISPRSIASDST